MNIYLRQALCEKIVQGMHQKVEHEEHTPLAFLLITPQKWRNQHFEQVASATEIDAQFLKRLFGYIKTTDFEISKPNREKITAFLGYSTWESLETELILRASLEIMIKKCIEKS